MNKFLQKVAKIFLGLSMAAGVGLAVSAKVKSPESVNATDGTITFSGGSFNSNVITWTDGSPTHLTVKQEKNTGQTAPSSSYVSSPRWYSGNKVTFTPASGVTITSMTITATSNSYATALRNSTVSSGDFGGSGTTVTWSGSTSSAFNVVLGGQCRLGTSMSFVYTAGGTTYTVTISRNNSDYGTVSSNSVGSVASGTSISASGNVLTIGNTQVTATPSATTAQYSYSFDEWTGIPAGGTVTANVTVTANFSRSEVVAATGITLKSSTTIEQGDSETLTATVTPDNATDKTVSWSITPTGQGVSISNGTVSATASATLGNYTVTATANGGTNVSATCTVTVKASTKVTDTINYSFTGISGSGYKSWSGKTGSSGAVYAGQSNAGVSYVQIRNQSSSGIVTTSSGGIAKSIKVTWGGSNTNGRVVTIYGKNTAYSEPADLYDNSKIGTSAGSVTFSTGAVSASTNLTGNYQYIGIHSNGAAYMTSIEITWSSLTKLATPVPTFDNNNKQVTWPAVEHASSYEVKVDSGSYAAATSPFSVSSLTEDAEHTVYVVAKGDNTTYSDSDAGHVTFTPTTPKNIVIVSNTIKENGVAVNATVTKDGCYNDDTFTFTATIVYQSGTGYDEGDGAVTWASSSESVATITSGGIVTPIANGSTTISATPIEGNNAAQKVASFTLVISNIKERVYDDIVDEIVLSDTGISGNSYSDWSGVSKPSGAVYAGTTNENDNGGIGMRASSATGIWVTTSPGVATKVEVTWTTNTSRNVYVFGKDTAYSSAAQYSDMLGEQIGHITYSSTVINLSKEYKFIAMCVTGGAAGFSKIKVTWKVPGAEFPLTADPVLSTGSTATAYVGKNLALDVTTTPSNSDEKLIATSSNENYVTVSGSGKSFVIFGVAVGSSTVTIEGAKGDYSASVVVTVEEAVKTYEDKIITPAAINITGKSYADNNAAPHDYDGVSFTTHQVQLSNNALSFQQGAGYIQNSEVLYEENSVPAKIKAITLFMHADNEGTATVYEGTSVGPSTAVSASCTTGDVITYTFSSGMTYFKILETGASKVLRIDRFIIELADDTNSVLNEARSATNIIINGLKNTCGAGNSGVVTQSQWNSINSSIAALNLTPDAKLFIKDAARISLENLSQGGVTIENAMAHYDYCVTKFHFTPYEGITHAQASPRVSSLSILNNNTSTVAIIVIISMVSVTAIGGYFFLRKRKENI